MSQWYENSSEPPGGSDELNIKADIEPNIKPDLAARVQALKAKLIV